MAQKHSLCIPAHHNIYTGTVSTRMLRIEFSIPDDGVNLNTGLVMLVPGFGADIDSNVYKKMRDVFADTYNLITIQCHYFGSHYMQDTDSITLENTDFVRKYLNRNEKKHVNDQAKLLEILSKKNISIPVNADMEEIAEDFNDMSYMQAIDIITAIEVIKVILDDNNMIIDRERIIGYGHSHGAYLLHLSNRLSNVFSYIIDNSAWLEPVYLHENRMIYKSLGSARLLIQFDYFAKKMIPNKKSLHMKELYKDLHNTAQILSFQGDDDHLVNHIDKQKIMNKINNAEFVLIKKTDIDNIKFKSNGHGLNADFLELFSYALELETSTSQLNEPPDKININGVSIKSDYSKGLPVFTVMFP